MVSVKSIRPIFFVIAVIACFISTTVIGERDAQAAKRSAKAKANSCKTVKCRNAVKHGSKKFASRRAKSRRSSHKALRYVAPPDQFEMSPERLARREALRQEAHSIINTAGSASSVVDLLAANDINGALIAMREKPKDPKLRYLTREASLLAMYSMGDRPKGDDASASYFNLAIANHNIYLYLKAYGVDQFRYAKAAHKFYSKAKRGVDGRRKAQRNLLDAALYAASGKRDKAQHVINDIDPVFLGGDYESEANMASYRASMGDAEGAVSSLEKAYKLNPERTTTWLAVADDFHAISSEPRYKELRNSLKVDGVEKQLAANLPKQRKQKIDKDDPSEQYRPQRSASKKAVVKKGAQGKRSKQAIKNKKGKSVKVSKTSKAKAAVKAKVVKAKK